MHATLFLALQLLADASPPTSSAPVRAVWLADMAPDRVQPSPGRFVFVSGSAADEVDGRVLVEAAGPPGVLRTVSFAKGETDEGLNVARPVVSFLFSCPPIWPCGERSKPLALRRSNERRRLRAAETGLTV
jgi:hypothetical protein